MALARASKTSRSRTHRARWAAIGAAVAVCLGAGGLLTASAASPGASAFVPIVPCRLTDTRAIGTVGPRSTPLGSSETYATMVRGSNGNCSIPAEATAVSLNVSIVNPTAGSYLTVYPTDAPRPVVSNLNWVANQAPTPNAVTAKLAADGSLALFNLNGTVDLIVDIVGYYETAGAGTAGPPGPAGAPGPAGPAGLLYVGSFTGSVITAIGVSVTPPAPVGYVATFDLAAGRYLVTGDLSIQNRTSNSGTVVCRPFFNSTTIGNPAVQSYGGSEFGNLSFSNTFVLTTGGSTTVSFRCYREGASVDVVYWFANMTVFKVD